VASRPLLDGELIFLLVGGPAVLAVAGCLVGFPALGNSEFEKASEALRGGFTVLFGLILGLSIASVSGELSMAQSTVSSEATTLAQMVRISQALPPADRDAIDQAISEYVHAVAADEWDAMRNGKASPRAAAALDNLYKVYQEHPPPPGPLAAPYLAASLSKLDALTSARRPRLQQATSGSSGRKLAHPDLALEVSDCGGVPGAVLDHLGCPHRVGQRREVEMLEERPQLRAALDRIGHGCGRSHGEGRPQGRQGESRPACGRCAQKLAPRLLKSGRLQRNADSATRLSPGGAGWICRERGLQAQRLSSPCKRRGNSH
jgi:hypothetical protein